MAHIEILMIKFSVAGLVTILPQVHRGAGTTTRHICRVLGHDLCSGGGGGGDAVSGAGGR